VVGPDGTVDVSLSFDQRVLGLGSAGEALEEMEEVLKEGS
jgi:hypothetical protein